MRGFRHFRPGLDFAIWEGMKTSQDWLRQSEETDAHASALEAEANAIASGRHPEWRHQDIRAEGARWRLDMAADYRRWAAAERDIASRIAALEAEEEARKVAT